MIKGIVAIVGRPNVGKSTFFNRFTRSRKAIVDDQPGVTRDRIYGLAYYDQEKTSGFQLIDTGGFETDDFKFQPFSENLVWQQTEQAIKAADLVLLMLDSKSGTHPHDKELIRFLQKTKKQFLCLLNKVDGEEHKQSTWDFFSLGLSQEDIIPISAAYNRGMTEVRTRIKRIITGQKVKNNLTLPDTKNSIHLALVGRPNAGKSSILNRLAGEERSLVSDIPGTTRDSIDLQLRYHNHDYIIVDTAGLRRKTRVNTKLEAYSITRSLEAIDRADVVVCVIDAVEGLTDQDARIINLALDRFKPTMIAVNKWDLVEEKDSTTMRQYEKNLKLILGQRGFVPVIFISCTTNQRVRKIFDMTQELFAEYTHRSPTHKVNEALQQIIHEHTPQLIRKYNKRVKFYYATQTEVKPPTLVIKCNVASEIQSSYVHYMHKKFGELLGLGHVPFRMIFREKDKKDKLKEKEAET